MMICLVLTVLSACGGGGGGDAGITVQQPTTAVITLATTGTITANTIITGYDVLIRLPAGVTVKSTTSPQTDSGVVTATGTASGSSVVAVYSAATSTLSGTVRILIAKADGFSGAGEFGTVNCDIAAGYYPKTTDFPLPTFVASGLDISDPDYPSTVDPINNLTLTSTVVIN
jgi:hypothetical protein